MTDRRDLVFLLGAAALAPRAVLAQAKPAAGKVWRVGFLIQRHRPASLDSDIFGAFLRSMRELGYVEGKNLEIEWRFAEGQYERLPRMAAELVAVRVDVIVTDGTNGVRAAQRATTTIPIVFGGAGDPVGDRLVNSLARPGGNTTGLSNVAGDLGSKHLELLVGVVPKLSRAAILMNPDNSSHFTILKDIQLAARSIQVNVQPFHARTLPEIENAFPGMIREKSNALIVIPDPFFISQWRQIAELAARSRLPSISRFQEYPQAGGLMSYGNSNEDNYGRAAYYVDRIFKGARPGDLPVEQPTKFYLVVNMKTARALGITIPPSVLVRADRVIE